MNSEPTNIGAEFQVLYAGLPPYERVWVDDFIRALAKLCRVKRLGVSAKEQFYLESSRRLKILRRHSGHSPQGFATRLGMTKGAYLSYEKGQRGFRGWRNMLYRMVHLTLPMPVSLGWLVTGQEGHGRKRNDNRPLFRFPDGSFRPMRPRPCVTARTGNVVVVEFGGASLAHVAAKGSSPRAVT